MKIWQLFEGDSDRLSVKETDVGIKGKTWLFEATLLDKGPYGSDNVVVELWGSLKEENIFYISQIVSHYSGRGYGVELMQYVIKTLKEHSIKRIEGYVVKSNIESMNMLRKCKFIEDSHTKDGTYWSLNL